MKDTLLPHSNDAERSVLGAILLDNDALSRARAIVGPDDFFRDPHRRIYRAMLRLAESGTALDPVTVKEDLIRAGDLDAAGGPAYIAALLDGVPYSSNVEHYAKIVKEKAGDRAALVASDAFRRALMERNGAGPGEGRESIESAAATLRSALDAQGAGAVTAFEIGRVRLGDYDPAVAPPAVFGDPAAEVLIPAGDVIIVAADPGTGKTLFALDAAIACATGAPFLGFPCAASGRALVLAADGDGEAVILRRAARLALGRGLSAADLDDDRLFIAAPDGLCLDVPAHFATVTALVDRHNPDIVFLDSLNVLPAPTADLTVAQQAIAFIKGRVRPLQTRPDGSRRTILVAHHLRKRSGQPGANAVRDRVGGSYAVTAGVDCVLALESGSPDTFTVKIVKRSRTGATFAAFLARIEGEPTAPLTLVKIGPVVQPVAERIADDRALADALAVMAGPEGWTRIATLKSRLDSTTPGKARAVERSIARAVKAGTVERHESRRGLVRLAPATDPEGDES